MEYSLEKLKEKYATLPKDLQEAVLSVDSNKVLREITKTNKLHIDQAAEMSDETGLVMLGLTHPGEYVANLKNRLKISEEQARAIAKEVNEKIFVEIKESLKKIHETESGSSPEIVDKKQEDTLELKTTQEEDNLKRDDVLKELEKPEPLIPKTIPKETLIEKTMEDEKKEAPSMQIVKKKEEGIIPIDTGKDLVESQLEKPSTIPSSETTIEVPEKKDYVVDPYREPIE